MISVHKGYGNLIKLLLKFNADLNAIDHVIKYKKNIK